MGKCCTIILAVGVTLGHLAALALQAYVAATNVPLAFSVQNAQCKVRDRKLMTMSFQDEGLAPQAGGGSETSPLLGSVSASSDQWLSLLHSKVLKSNVLTSPQGKEDRKDEYEGVPLSCVVSNLESSKIYKLGDLRKNETLRNKRLLRRNRYSGINKENIKDACETNLFVPKYAFVFVGFQKHTNIMCCNEINRSPSIEYVEPKREYTSYVNLAKKGLLSSLTISIKELPKSESADTTDENVELRNSVADAPLITRLVISKETEEGKPQFEFRGIGTQNLVIKDNNGTLEIFMPLGKLDCPYTLADNVYLQLSLYLHVLVLTGTALLLPLSLLALTRHAPRGPGAAPSPAALAVTAVITALAGLACAFCWSRATLGGFDKLWTFPAFIATLVHGLAAAAVVLVAAVAAGRRAEEHDLTQSSCHYTSSVSGLSGMYDVTGSGAFPSLTPTPPMLPTPKESTAYFPSFSAVSTGTPKSAGRRASEATPLLLNGSFY